MAHLKRNNYKEIYAKPPGIDAMMREVMQRLGDIDFEYAVEVEKLQNGTSHPRLKPAIEARIRSAHHDRREPYVELLTALKLRQQRLAFLM